MPISVIILIIVLVGILFRDVSPVRLPIWALMLGGAVVTLLCQQISIPSAWHSISWNIIGYLVGVFIIGQALEESGLLYQMSERLFTHVHGGGLFMLTLIFVFGLTSALLMNDTIAIIATPLLIMIAKENKLNTTPLLLALAFSVTIGSALSPIGNPQNLLIASNSGMMFPFKAFLEHLTIPTLICLGICFLFFFIFYRKTIINKKISITMEQQLHAPLARLCKCSLVLLIALIIFKITLESMSHHKLNFSAIALISCAPIVFFAKDRITIIKKMDWHTILFFIGMFILIQSVWDSGMLQRYIQSHHLAINHIPTILIISTLLSQFISNVPLVALYLPLLVHHNGATHQFLALSVGSTIAGNFLIMGAASNIIIILNAEKRGAHAFNFWEFVRMGVPLGVICLLVYWVFI